MIRARLTAENSIVRNELRNLTAYVMNKIQPGLQRNCTSRDAKALNESTDFSQATNYDVLSANDVIMGVSVAGP